ncbi:hypothetical protein BC936DRAFT_142576 [Jimgerdemannia flammicorona]|uniref:Uncharacterized protein n=1 Tax=Jimgerdemannia flammicorona TaxID=994334 RepID=A0A433DF36_9FUNG|nr:hypothetical protein BC936DRAFT_142576 [Jimgerdemannia flammicorona]
MGRQRAKGKAVVINGNNDNEIADVTPSSFLLITSLAEVAGSTQKTFQADPEHPRIVIKNDNTQKETEPLARFCSLQAREPGKDRREGRREATKKMLNDGYWPLCKENMVEIGFGNG